MAAARRAGDKTRFGQSASTRGVLPRMYSVVRRTETTKAPPSCRYSKLRAVSAKRTMPGRTAVAHEVISTHQLCVMHWEALKRNKISHHWRGRAWRRDERLES